MITLADMVLASLFSAAILALEHFIPWGLWFGRQPHPTLRYVMGLLGLLLPISIVLMVRGMVAVVVLVWLVAATGGSVVLVCYLIDAAAGRRHERDVAVREGEVLRGQIFRD